MNKLENIGPAWNTLAVLECGGDDTALMRPAGWPCLGLPSESGVALRLPPQSKMPARILMPGISQFQIGGWP